MFDFFIGVILPPVAIITIVVVLLSIAFKGHGKRKNSRRLMGLTKNFEWIELLEYERYSVSGSLTTEDGDIDPVDLMLVGAKNGVTFDVGDEKVMFVPTDFHAFKVVSREREY